MVKLDLVYWLFFLLISESELLVTQITMYYATNLEKTASIYYELVLFFKESIYSVAEFTCS